MGYLIRDRCHKNSLFYEYPIQLYWVLKICIWLIDRIFRNKCVCTRSWNEIISGFSKLQFKSFSGISSCRVPHKPGELKVLHTKVTHLNKNGFWVSKDHLCCHFQPSVENDIQISPLNQMRTSHPTSWSIPSLPAKFLQRFRASQISDYLNWQCQILQTASVQQESTFGNSKIPGITMSFLWIILLHTISTLFYFCSHIKDIPEVDTSPILQNIFITLT